MATLVFIDTEFTRLGGDGLPGLISIGLISEDGEECYVEVDDFVPEDCSDFVLTNVLPLRTGPMFSRAAASEAVWTFLAGLASKPAILIHDYFVDIELCLALLRSTNTQDDWQHIVVGYCSARQQATSQAFIDSRQQFAAQPGFVLHHALHDARALRAGWQGWSALHPSSRGNLIMELSPERS